MSTTQSTTESFTHCPTCLDPNTSLDDLFAHACPHDTRHNYRPRHTDPMPARPRGDGTGPGRGHGGHGPGATPAQVAYLVRLGMDETAARRLGKIAAGHEIDKRLAERPAPAADQDRRPNRYAGQCIRCGGQVPAESGWLAKDPSGRWAAEHKSCPDAPDAPAADVPEATPGFYVWGERVVKVTRSKAGRLYALALDDETGRFEYDTAATRGWQHAIATGEARRLTVEEAAAYGRRTGRCMCCGRTLTNPESIAAGIGPICAGGL